MEQGLSQMVHTVLDLNDGAELWPTPGNQETGKRRLKEADSLDVSPMELEVLAGHPVRFLPFSSGTTLPHKGHLTMSGNILVFTVGSPECS